MTNKDQMTGKGKEIQGRMQAAVGVLTGDKEAEVEGRAKEVEGKTQQVVGDVKEALHKAID